MTSAPGYYVARMEHEIAAFENAVAMIRKLEAAALDQVFIAAAHRQRRKATTQPSVEYMADRLLADNHVYGELCGKRAAARSTATMYGIAALAAAAANEREALP